MSYRWHPSYWWVAQERKKCLRKYLSPFHRACRSTTYAAILTTLQTAWWLLASAAATTAAASAPSSSDMLVAAAAGATAAHALLPLPPAGACSFFSTFLVSQRVSVVQRPHGAAHEWPHGRGSPHLGWAFFFSEMGCGVRGRLPNSTRLRVPIKTDQKSRKKDQSTGLGF